MSAVIEDRDMGVTINIVGTTLKPSPDIRILGAQLDTIYSQMARAYQRRP